MRRWLLAAAVGGAACAAAARADSIWDRRDPRYANLFQDNRARNVGDLVTVLVTESTVASDQDQRQLARTGSFAGQLNFFGGANTTSTATNTAIPGVAVGLPGGSTNLAFNGSSQFTANRVFTDQIAATVVDLMPNGNLVIEGYRSRIVAGEERVLRFTGQVRPADIGVGNAVSSQVVANLRVSYLGRGPATRATQGPIGRIANLVGPR